MKLEQAARQALEALCVAVEPKRGRYYCMNEQPVDMVVKYTEAITALREALSEQATVSGGLCGGCAKKVADGWALYCVDCWEKAEQEPVACKHEWFRTGAMQIGESRCIHCGEWNYTAPVRTKDLTDDEIYKLADDVDWAAGAYLGFARAVIAADREKNK